MGISKRSRHLRVGNAACVQILHGPIFVDAAGCSFTNGPTVFLSRHIIVECDKPLLEWLIAAARTDNAS